VLAASRRAFALDECRTLMQLVAEARCGCALAAQCQKPMLDDVSRYDVAPVEWVDSDAHDPISGTVYL
jgi:hypothetical protein